MANGHADGSPPGHGAAPTDRANKESLTYLPQSADDDDTRLQRLLAWADERHIWVHDDISIQRMPQSAGAVQRWEEGSALAAGPAPADQDHNSNSESADPDPADGDGDEDDLALGDGFGVYTARGASLEPRQVRACKPSPARILPNT